MANKPMKGKVMVRFKNVKPQEEDNSDDDVYVQSSVELSDNGLIKMLTDEIQYNIDGLINAGSSVALKRDCIEKVFDKVASSRQIMMALRANGMATDLLKLPALLSVEKDFYINMYMLSLVYVLSLTKNYNAVSLEMPKYTFTALLSAVFGAHHSSTSVIESVDEVRCESSSSTLGVSTYCDKRKLSRDESELGDAAVLSFTSESVNAPRANSVKDTQATSPTPVDRVNGKNTKFHKRRKMHSSFVAVGSHVEVPLPTSTVSPPNDDLFGLDADKSRMDTYMSTSLHHEPPVRADFCLSPRLGERNSTTPVPPNPVHVLFPCSGSAYLHEPGTDTRSSEDTTTINGVSASTSGVTKEFWRALFHGLLSDHISSAEPETFSQSDLRTADSGNSSGVGITTGAVGSKHTMYLVGASGAFADTALNSSSAFVTAQVQATVQTLFGLYIVNRFLFNKVQKIASESVAQVRGDDDDDEDGHCQGQYGRMREEAKQLEIEQQYLCTYQHLLRGSRPSQLSSIGHKHGTDGSNDFFRDLYSMIHEDSSYVCGAETNARTNTGIQGGEWCKTTKTRSDAWRGSRLYICLGLIESACFRCVENEMALALMKVPRVSDLSSAPSSPSLIHVSPSPSAATPTVIGAVYVFELLNRLTTCVFSSVNDLIYAMNADTVKSPTGSPMIHQKSGDVGNGMHKFLPELVVPLGMHTSSSSISSIDIWLVSFKALINMTHSCGTFGSGSNFTGATDSRAAASKAIGVKLLEAGCLKWCVALLQQISQWNEDFKRIGANADLQGELISNGNIDANGEFSMKGGDATTSSSTYGSSNSKSCPTVRNSNALSPDESVIDKIVYDCTLFVLALLTNLTPVIKQCCKDKDVVTNVCVVSRADRVDLVSHLVSLLLCEADAFMGIIIDTDSTISTKHDLSDATTVAVVGGDSYVDDKVDSLVNITSSPLATSSSNTLQGTPLQSSVSTFVRSPPSVTGGESLPIAEINLTGHIALVLFRLAYNTSNRCTNSRGITGDLGAGATAVRGVGSKETSVDVEFNRLVCDRLPHGSWWLPIRVLKGFLALQSKTGVIIADTVYPVLEAIHTLENYQQCAGRAPEVDLLLATSAKEEDENVNSQNMEGESDDVGISVCGSTANWLISGRRGDVDVGARVNAKPSSVVFSGVASIFGVDECVGANKTECANKQPLVTQNHVQTGRHASVTSLVFKSDRLPSAVVNCGLKSDGDAEQTLQMHSDDIKAPNPISTGGGVPQVKPLTASEKTAQMVFSNQYSVKGRIVGQASSSFLNDSRHSSPVPMNSDGSSGGVVGNSNTESVLSRTNKTPLVCASAGVSRMRYDLSVTNTAFGSNIDSPMSTTSCLSHVSDSSCLKNGSNFRVKNKMNGWRCKLSSGRSVVHHNSAEPPTPVGKSPSAPVSVFDFDFP